MSANTKTMFFEHNFQTSCLYCIYPQQPIIHYFMLRQFKSSYFLKLRCFFFKKKSILSVCFNVPDMFFFLITVKINRNKHK